MALLDGRLLLAPELICAELANAVWSKVRSRELSVADAQEAIDRFRRDASIELRPMEPLLSAAMTMALRLNHPAYDCFYLALAQQERCPLVTADQRLQAIVRGTDLEPLVEPL